MAQMTAARSVVNGGLSAGIFLSSVKNIGSEWPGNGRSGGELGGLWLCVVYLSDFEVQTLDKHHVTCVTYKLRSYSGSQCIIALQREVKLL